MFHLHRWSKWTPHEHYIDSSYGGRAQSTLLIRRCFCGLVKSKGLYGMTLPIPPEKVDER